MSKNTKVVAKAQWEIIEQDDIPLGDGDLVCIEELKDYELVNYQSTKHRPNNKRLKTKKRLKNKELIALPDLQNVNISQWNKQFSRIPESLLNGISALGFVSPTAIQKAVISSALIHKNIIASAQTGSGKTLAFLIPIFSQIVEDHQIIQIKSKNETVSNIQALIITPTRELAIQIKSHALSLSQFASIKVVTLVGGMSIQKQERLLKHRPHVIIATPGRLKDLLSLFKVDNFLHNVSEPGIFGKKLSTVNESSPQYLYKMAGFDVDTLIDLRGLKYFVMDEADKMVTAGHWRDMKSILIHLKNLWKKYELKPCVQTYIISATLNIPLNTFKNSLKLPTDETQKLVKKGRHAKAKSGFENSSKLSIIKKFKRLLTSLPFTLRQTAKGKSINTDLNNDNNNNNHDNINNMPVAKKIKINPKQKLDDSNKRATGSIMKLADPEFFIVDLSPKQITVPTLQELRVSCSNYNEKDIYLYYFLTAYLYHHLQVKELIAAQKDNPVTVLPDYKVLVFCNSIDCVRRLFGLFTLLLAFDHSIRVLPHTRYSIYRLHASMSQRDRLKCLDKFLGQEKPNTESFASSFHISILLATDLAARGIDLEGTLNCVVHYEMSDTFAGFVHRSGRTARAGREGLSLVLLCPDREGLRYTSYVKQRGMTLATIATLDEPSTALLKTLNERVAMANNLETLIHRTAKSSRHLTWAQKVSEAFELSASDQDDNSDVDDNRNNDNKNNSNKSEKRMIEKAKREFKQMLNNTSLLSRIR